ncbi:hypothetical protein JCM10213v2_006752 [Rhodosporidiobolus nylandii]
MSMPATTHSLPPELLIKASKLYKRAACVIVAKSDNLEALFLDHPLEFLDDLKAFASALVHHDHSSLRRLHLPTFGGSLTASIIHACPDLEELSTTGVFYNMQENGADDRHLENHNLSPPTFRLLDRFDKDEAPVFPSSALLPVLPPDLSSLSLGSRVPTLGDVGTLLAEGRLAKLDGVKLPDYMRESGEEKEVLEASAESRGIEAQWANKK